MRSARSGGGQRRYLYALFSTARILNFHVVRSTRPCQFTPACFLGNTEFRKVRDPGHVNRLPDYPDPKYYLNYTGKYFFRHASLRHLRVEQVRVFVWCPTGISMFPRHRQIKRWPVYPISIHVRRSWILGFEHPRGHGERRGARACGHWSPFLGRAKGAAHKGGSQRKERHASTLRPGSE